MSCDAISHNYTLSNKIKIPAGYKGKTMQAPRVTDRQASKDMGQVAIRNLQCFASRLSVVNVELWGKLNQQ